MNEVINTGLSASDYQWIQEMKKIIMDSIPFSSDPDLYTLDSIREYPLVNDKVCFQYVVNSNQLFDSSPSLIE